MPHLPATLAALLAALAHAGGGGADSAGYDVLAYRLDVLVDPAVQRLEGTGYALLTALEPLRVVELDLSRDLTVSAAREVTGDAEAEVSPAGRPAAFEREGDVVRVRLSRLHERGEVVTVAVRYAGAPGARDDLFGVHWKRTAQGEPWVSTSVQGVGARAFWPCKDSFFRPADRPQRVRVNLTVPRGLWGVSNGRLEERVPDGEWETFRWVQPYPMGTYGLTLNVGPFVCVERELELPGSERSVPFAYWVLPDDVEKAQLEFARVPEIAAVYARYFGPWPFPDAKLGIVSTSFLGMEHPTALAYGSSYPAWRRRQGLADPWAQRNRLFDYVLVHELAHEWWGNAVSASDWGHFWIHEGFGTYAEALVAEALHGRATADEYLERMRSWVAEDSRLFRGRGKSSEEAYGSVLYVKGAWVLNTLRHYVADDELWWRALREFNLRHRYGTVDTEDFRAVLEELSGKSFARFFDEWVYGVGFPCLAGTVRAEGDTIAVEIENPVRHESPFHVPLDLAWSEGDARRTARVWVEPGRSSLVVPCGAPPRGIEVVDLHRVLGKHNVVVRDDP